MAASLTWCWRCVTAAVNDSDAKRTQSGDSRWPAVAAQVEVTWRWSIVEQRPEDDVGVARWGHQQEIEHMVGDGSDREQDDRAGALGRHHEETAESDYEHGADEGVHRTLGERDAEDPGD